MQRRDFLQLIALAGVSGLSPAISFANANPARQQMIEAWRARVKAILARGRLPIIDTQATYIADKTNVERMVGFMNELDVAQIAFAPAYDITAASSLELQRNYPDYFIPTSNSGEWPAWWKQTDTFLAAVRQQMESGHFFIMGEHEFRHYPSPEQVAAGQLGRDTTVDITGPGGHALFKLSEEFGLAFEIHYEIEDRLLPGLEAMLAKYPKAKVIWCHLAQIRYPDRNTIYGPDYVRSLIGRFPNLYFDLTFSHTGSTYGPSGARDATIYTPYGTLRDDWKAVLEAYPERILAASDYRPPVEVHYPKIINLLRSNILSKLSDRSQHLIAYQNAWRLLTGETWAS